MSLRGALDLVNELPVANAYLNARYSSVSVNGIENLPKSGAALIVSNHEHIDDAFIYYRLLLEELGRTPRFAVNKDVYEWPGPHGALMREFLLSRRQIPVDRFDPRSAVDLRDAMNAEMKIGELGVIFPEKTTPKTGYVHRFHTVAAQIAIDNSVPITMMHIRYSKPPHSLRRNVVVNIAPPLTHQDFNGMNRHELSLELQTGVGALGHQALSTEWGSDPEGYTSEWHSDRFIEA